MVVVTSPSKRQAQRWANIRVQVLVSAAILLSVLAVFLVFFSDSESSSGSSGTAKRSLATKLRLPVNKKTKQQALKPWPALADVYDGQKVIADPQFLLDFAIIGFEKSGTSTLMKWLGAHPEVQLIQEEIYDLYRNRTGSLVWRMHSQLKPGFEYKRGYKSPIDIFSANVLHLLDTYFPRTRLILALRHPVLYYQSLYNFRIQNLPGPNDTFILPLDGIGDCRDDSQGVCTDRANFAEYMYRMGKTLSMFPHETDKEIVKANPTSAAKARVTRNLVFVVELTQFMDHDSTRKEILRKDLKSFLGLEADLEDVVWAKPGKQWSPEVQAMKDARKICICDDQYIPLREELMRVSRLTSTWIRESFLKSDDVFISSPEFFDEVMMKWMEDPCETGDPCKGIKPSVIS